MITRLTLLLACLFAQQVTGQDIDKILEKADLLLEEAKTGYEEARTNSSVPRFLEAGFKLEEARIKYLVLQEIGTPEKQKVAADRLRAVNQLGKLIHDGKVAISGTPVDAPPAPEAPDKPATPPPAKVSVDVMARIAVPDAAKQKETGKLIKDVFKEQYAKKTPADRKALARALLDQAAKTPDDRVAQWVLYSEAVDAAVQGGDVRTAFEAIDGTARVFDVDAMPMKQAALTTAGKTAAAPEEFAALAAALDKMVDEWIVADQYDPADKAANLAVQYARRSKDVALAMRVQARVKEIADAKAKFKSMKGALETLAKTPDNPGANAEMGQFLCFVKGSWDLGLRFLLKGNDAALRALAEKELAYPSKPEELVALADGWWDLAVKEKSPIRKSQLQAHLKLFYDMALPETTGLVRAKIDKRLTDLEDAQISGINLLRAIDPKLDGIKGVWTLEGRSLVGQQAEPFCLMIPYLPPEEYDLTVVVTRREGGDSIVLGLVGGNSQFDFTLDGHSGSGCLSGLECLDGKYLDQYPGPVKGRQVNQGQTVTVVCSIRKAGVTVTLDGKKFVDWQGNYSRLSQSIFYRVPNPKAMILGGWGGKIEISKLYLNPVTGQGKRLR